MSDTDITLDRRSVLRATAGVAAAGLGVGAAGSVSADVDRENCDCEYEYKCEPADYCIHAEDGETEVRRTDADTESPTNQEYRRECCTCDGETICSDWGISGCC